MKMKKFLCLIIAMLLVISSITVTAFAEDTQVSNDGTAYSVLEFRQPCAYCVLIPESIDLSDGTGYRFNAAEMNLDDDTKLAVMITNLTDGKLQFAHENGKYYVSKRIFGELANGETPIDGVAPDNCVAYFVRDNCMSKYIMRIGSENYDYDNVVKAGKYSATAEFTIQFVY